MACIDGEWHALPARLVAEVLRLRGWRVDYLGAQVPTPHLISHLHRAGPEAVALSSSIATRLPAAHAHVVQAAPALIRHVMNGLRTRFPAMAGYTEHQLSRTTEDVAHIVEFLGTALYLDDPDLFTGFLTWTAGILTARDVPAHSLLPALDLLSERLSDHPRATGMLARAEEAVREHPAGALRVPAASEDAGAPGRADIA